MPLGARVVWLTEKPNIEGNSFIRRDINVPLPTPEGPLITTGFSTFPITPLLHATTSVPKFFFCCCLTYVVSTSRNHIQSSGLEFFLRISILSFKSTAEWPLHEMGLVPSSTTLTHSPRQLLSRI
ncbi:hypothetical protein V8G54_028729 [Vigna mungo]|uniref:Uncharacterized protein n=1 Tax=Vigna mungo TaxID=3915 RepID=A0AAQ3MTB8_VIGMU